jgi:hypothetical protein
MSDKKQTNGRINILLWAAQVLLALGFFWAAGMKFFQPAGKLAEMWPWTAEHPLLVKFTGLSDLLTGMGLILPALLRIRPGLTIYAAYGTIALMIAAGIFHIARGESGQTGINIFFALIALFILWGRLKKVPIAGRTTG